MTTRQKAISALLEADKLDAAETLECWRNKNKRGGGWDGWFRTAYPDLVWIVWPWEEATGKKFSPSRAQAPQALPQSREQKNE